MKKISKITTLFLAGFMAFMIMFTFSASATENNSGESTDTTGEGKKVIAHIFNCYEGPNLYIYNWGDAGEIFSAWPGKKLDEKDENGWYEKEFTATETLNLLFGCDANEDGAVSNGVGGDYQTNNLPELPADIGEIWVIISSEDAASADEVNAYEIDAGASGYVYTIPQDGWPVSDTYVKPDEEKYSKEVIDLGVEPTKQPEATKTPAKNSSTNNESNNNIIIYIIIGVVCIGVAAAVVVICKKRKK